MLSEEENKAIKECDIIFMCLDDAMSEDSANDYRKSYKILKNLIEKQQKEIEELKNGQIDFWISDKEIEERIRNKFVSNDKIKAKIEELDIEIQCCEYADDDLEEYKQDMEKEKTRLLRDKAILQSLLEEEE